MDDDAVDTYAQTFAAAHPPPTSSGGAERGDWWTPERVDQAVTHLQQNAGLSPMGARGLVARWAGVEARGGPNSVNPNSGAIGIGQWLGGRKSGVPADFTGQLNHAARELNTTESAAAKRLRNAQTAEDAAIGASMFERAEGYDPKTGRDNFVTPTIRTMQGMGRSQPVDNYAQTFAEANPPNADNYAQSFAQDHPPVGSSQTEPTVPQGTVLRPVIPESGKPMMLPSDVPQTPVSPTVPGAPVTLQTPTVPIGGMAQVGQAALQVPVNPVQPIPIQPKQPIVPQGHTSEPVIGADIAPETLPPVVSANADNAVAETIEVPENIKDKEAASDYVRKQLQALHPSADFSKQGLLDDYEPGQPVQISKAYLESALKAGGVTSSPEDMAAQRKAEALAAPTDEALRQRVIDELTDEKRAKGLNRFDRDAPEASSKQSLALSEDEIQKRIDEYKAQELSPEAKSSAYDVAQKNAGIGGAGLSGLYAGAGSVIHTAAGVLRPFSTLGIPGYDMLSKLGKEMQSVSGYRNEGKGSKNPGESIAGFIGESIPSLGEMFVIPGGPVAKFAFLGGAKAAGAGASASDIGKGTVEGAITGKAFQIAEGLKNPLARLGTVFGGSMVANIATGVPLDQSFHKSLMNTAFQGVNDGLMKAGEMYRFWKDGKAADIQIDDKGEVLLQPTDPNRQVAGEIVLDPKNDVYNQPKASFKGSTETTLTPEVTTKAPQESAKEGPQRKPEAQPAVKDARIDRLVQDGEVAPSLEAKLRQLNAEGKSVELDKALKPLEKAAGYNPGESSAPQIEVAAAEDKAKAIDDGTTTIAPNEILKTATELVDQHENELRSSSPDVVSGTTESDKGTESGTSITPSQDNAPTLAKSVSESTKAAVDAAEAGKAASPAGEPASGRESGRTISERTPEATSEFKPKDRVKDNIGRTGIIEEKSDGSLFVRGDKTQSVIPLSDKWKLVGKRAIEVNGFKKGDVVEKKGQLGKLYERAGQLRVKWTKDGVVKSEPFSDKWGKSANPEAGSVDPTLLTLGLNKTLQEDVGPGIRRAGQGLRGAYDDIKKLVFAPDRGQAAKLASTSLRAETGKMARSAAVAEHALKDARNYFSKNPIEDNYDFIAHVEGGDLASLPPDEQPAAQALRKLLDESRTRVQNLGTGKLENYIENYFPHIWEDPAKASSVFGKMLSKRPFEGSKAFLKQRVYNTFEEGLNAGLKPVSDNPVDLALLKMRDMDKYVAAHNTLQYLQSKGLSGMVKVGDRPPEGTIKIDDKVSSIQYFNDKGELAHGSLYAVEPAANIINNYLSPGLTGSKYGIVRDGYKAWRYMGNMMNQAQLGLSAFHAMFTTIDAATSKAALGINQLTSGRPVKALKSFAELPISPITNLIRGDKIYREGLTPGSTDEFSQTMANLIAEAGGRFKMDAFYHTKAAQRMMDAFKRGNILGGLVRTPGAALDVASRPLMQWLVPRQKLGVAADMMQHTLERLGPDATTEQIREAIGKDWDSVDNRMGQLVYDNLFWNKTIKDLSMASVRSVGWNLGDIRELGGAAKDVITSPKRIRQATRGETMPVPVVTQRMAYAAALPLVAGTIGAVTQYLFTGKGPDELKDYFFPKTGNTDENGNPERLSLPTYMKDIYAYSDHSGKTLANKAHPLIGLVAQMLTNKDYFGTEIRNSDDPLIEQMTDLAKHVGKGFMPFSVQGMLKERQRQGSTAAKTLSFFGFNPAPKDIDNTKAQSLAYEWWAEQKGTEPKTKVTAARNQEISDLVKLKKLGKDAEFEAEFERAQKAGVISTADRAQVDQRMTRNFFQYVVSRMPLEDALKIYEAASSDERTKMNDQMATKITNADKKEHITPQMREKMKTLGLSDEAGNTTIESPAKAPRKSSPKLPGFSKPRGLADMSYGRDNNAANEANSLTESEARQSIKTQEAQYPGGPTDIGDLPMPTEAAGTKPTREQSQHADKLLIALDQLKQKPYKTFWGTTNMPFTDTDVEAYQERINRMVEELKKIPLLPRQQKSFRYLSPENAPTSFKYGRMSDNVEDRRP